MPRSLIPQKKSIPMRIFQILHKSLLQTAAASISQTNTLTTLHSHKCAVARRNSDCIFRAAWPESLSSECIGIRREVQFALEARLTKGSQRRSFKEPQRKSPTKRTPGSMSGDGLDGSPTASTTTVEETSTWSSTGDEGIQTTSATTTSAESVETVTAAGTTAEPSSLPTSTATSTPTTQPASNQDAIVTMAPPPPPPPTNVGSGAPVESNPTPSSASPTAMPTAHTRPTRTSPPAASTGAANLLTPSSSLPPASATTDPGALMQTSPPSLDHVVAPTQQDLIPVPRDDTPPSSPPDDGIIHVDGPYDPSLTAGGADGGVWVSEGTYSTRVRTTVTSVTSAGGNLWGVLPTPHPPSDDLSSLLANGHLSPIAIAAVTLSVIAAILSAFTIFLFVRARRKKAAAVDKLAKSEKGIVDKCWDDHQAKKSASRYRPRWESVFAPPSAHFGVAAMLSKIAPASFLEGSSIRLPFDAPPQNFRPPRSTVSTKSLKAVPVEPFPANLKAPPKRPSNRPVSRRTVSISALAVETLANSSIPPPPFLSVSKPHLNTDSAGIPRGILRGGVASSSHVRAAGLKVSFTAPDSGELRDFSSDDPSTLPNEDTGDTSICLQDPFADHFHSETSIFDDGSGSQSRLDPFEGPPPSSTSEHEQKPLSHPPAFPARAALGGEAWVASYINQGPTP
ncbi:hypothetical protein M427DRAFT_40290 [Gonapodya prolifera JEL478]|uniref:Transmembrane protein n=1 Tax=Gonapodya prolifera (strain JEL478) TaxID=1344416 RepID=A0A139B0S6_GONPJ|nr:hypothetical protein M427DRAFT_40290 [Gonapodya prolifera JEL478]|eukprot:KXS22403.1 hypothetical protein M427DRAFT_40290 [Gonapodya prolifera JEL478]